MSSMSSLVNHFAIFRSFPNGFKQNIQLFHVFEDNIAYCVTNDDKVYGFGENVRKYLSYNQNNDNKSYVLIQQLCDKRIEEFFGFSDVFFARSETNAIYSYVWGNTFGQLGKGIYQKPQLNQYFEKKDIVQINFHYHCFALSSVIQIQIKILLPSLFNNKYKSD